MWESQQYVYPVFINPEQLVHFLECLPQSTPFHPTRWNFFTVSNTWASFLFQTLTVGIPLFQFQISMVRVIVSQIFTTFSRKHLEANKLIKVFMKRGFRPRFIDEILKFS